MISERPHYHWQIAPERTLPLGHRTLVMAILNVTPDSFSDGGRWADTDAAVRHAETMVRAGADIIDLGGESTRPGAGQVPEAEERARVLPVLRAILPLGVPVSIDTTKSGVARAALEAGAAIVNDVSGLRFDPGLARVVAEAGCGLVIMHSRGTPRDMQDDPRYHNVSSEVADELEEACAAAEARGIHRRQIVVDPGLGFAKRVEHNLELLRNLDRLVARERPVLVGASRKSFISRVLAVTMEERLEGSLVSAASAVLAGAHIVRVHDVEASVRAVRLADAIRKGIGFTE